MTSRLATSFGRLELHGSRKGMVSEPFGLSRFARLAQGEVLSLPKDEQERVEP